MGMGIGLGLGGLPFAATCLLPAGHMAAVGAVAVSLRRLNPPARVSPARLVLVDLPVADVVVLEQQERAGQG
jgi:hypothetical protein